MAAEKQEKLVLIDGHGLAYRMYFALNQAAFSTSAGEPTNATFGFTRTLLNLISSPDPPDYLAVSFDVGATFRDELFADYKGTREKMPEDLALQIDRIHQVLERFNVPILEAEGFEADDVLGTVAAAAEKIGLATVIVTGDKDLLQLVSEHTLVELPGRRAGSADTEVYDIQAVVDRFGVRPDQFVDYKAMIGDKSDNIPGVAGIGEKTAAKLLQEYGTLDAIYEHLDEITPKRAFTALEQGREAAHLSQKLAAIVRNVPIEFDPEACRTHEFDRDQVVAIFRELEFRSLIDQLPGAADLKPLVDGQQLSLFGSMGDSPPHSPAESPTQPIIVQDEAALDALARTLEGASAIAFDTETTSTDQMSAKLVGISLAVNEGEGYYIPIGHIGTDKPQLPLARVIERLIPAMTDPQITKIGHNIKYDAVILARHGLNVSPLSFDTMIGQWLVQPDGSRRKLGLKDQAFIRLGIEMIEITDLIGTGKKQITMDRVSIASAAPYAAADADMTLRLVAPIQAEITELQLEKLFHEIEMPLVPVLVDMEQAGVLIDSTILNQLSDEVAETLRGLEKEIYTVCGYEFNLNSSQQLSEALFDHLQLPTQGLRKTSSGRFSTAADVLDSLQEEDTTGVISLILQYREFEKLRSTYLDSLPSLVNSQTGRIHSSFNQTGAITGRISSSDPNLQNIPIRTEQGRRVREAFIAAPGYRLIAADYSQVELRILAHVSQDEGLSKAFHEDQDIHASTAAAVYGIPLEQVDRGQRSFAKSVNFGLMYGMGAYRLARSADLTLAEAEEFIKTYFERFPRVRAYLDGTLQMAAREGYVETLLGRRRYFPILQSTTANRQDRARAEREAINMPIQGTAADVIKIAMVRLHDALAARKLRGQMILQVHDELVLEAPEDEVDQMAALVVEVMENAYPLSVPLRVDVHVGQHWGEMK